MEVSKQPSDILRAHKSTTMPEIPTLPEIEINMTTTTPQISAPSISDNYRVHIMAGAAAGIMEHCVMYPVDSVKTRMQCLVPDKNAVYRNISDAFRKISATEGFFRPIRGINIVVAGAGPAHALYFSTYEIMKKTLGNHGSGHHPIANAVAGATATLFHDGLMNPVEVIKQRLQMYNSPYKGVLDCARTIFRSEGVPAFYRSYTTQLTMNLPFQCIHFVTYEFAREILNPAGGYDPKTHLLAGGCAGGIAAAITTPLDVAKTLLNTQEERAVCCLEQGKTIETCSSTKPFQGGDRRFVRGMVTGMTSIYKLRGWTGYFQGMRARVIYQAPSCAICWSVYEFLKYALSINITDDEMLELTV